MYRHVMRQFRKFSNDFPPYVARNDESDAVQRKRLLYQSRKRGISENGLLLSTFADRYLHNFTKDQLNQYDMLLNGADNDWDIYYWATGKEMPPSCYDNSVMELLKEHTLNNNKEKRYTQPELNK